MKYWWAFRNFFGLWPADVRRLQAVADDVLFLNSEALDFERRFAATGNPVFRKMADHAWQLANVWW
ncbi:hypothetical protein P3W33_11775 [Luteibacter sp. PPL552]